MGGWAAGGGKRKVTTGYHVFAEIQGTLDVLVAHCGEQLFAGQVTSIVTRLRALQGFDRYKTSIVTRLRALQDFDLYKTAIVTRVRSLQECILDRYKTSMVTRL